MGTAHTESTARCLDHAPRQPRPRSVGWSWACLPVPSQPLLLGGVLVRSSFGIGLYRTASSQIMALGLEG